MLKTLRIASRQSELARQQAHAVAASIIEKFPQIKVEFNFRESLGDKNLDQPLWQMPEKGVFTQDFYHDLLQSKVDLVVHSWKDLPVENRRGVSVVATLPRADVRDVLLVSKSWISDVSKHLHLRILTSSPRRIYNLQNCLKDLWPLKTEKFEYVNVRGNVPTRLGKLLSGEGDALVLAKAGLDRLLSFAESAPKVRQMLDQCEFMILPLSLNPSAAAQGALALEIKADNGPLRELLMAINSPETFTAVEAERRILKNYGGGCHQKIGINVLFRPFGRVTYLKGITDAGQVLDDLSHENLYEFKPWPKVSLDQCYPMKLDDPTWFDRKKLDAKLPTDRDVFVARENAYLDNFKPTPGKLTWCAGVKTWMRLAERGVWVHGCNDSLGEKELGDLSLFVGRELNWIKVSHKDSSDGMDVLPTYELIEKPEVPDLSQKTHFFWMSGSQFRAALKRFPQIANGYHACGPGFTYDELKASIADEVRVRVFLSFSEWQKSVLTGS